jgi:hypothetical protein
MKNFIIILLLSSDCFAQCESYPMQNPFYQSGSSFITDYIACSTADSVIYQFRAGIGTGGWCVVEVRYGGNTIGMDYVVVGPFIPQGFSNGIQPEAEARMSLSQWLIAGELYQIVITACSSDQLVINMETIIDGDVTIWFFDSACEPFTYMHMSDTHLNATVWESLSACLGDCNGDGFYGIADLLCLIGEYGKVGPSMLMDMNQDWIIDVEDYLILRDLMGTMCGAPP